MTGLRWGRVWLLALVALVACATPSIRANEPAGCEEAAEAVSFEEACVEESSLLVLCAGERCGLYRCREVMEASSAGRVVLARGAVLALPQAQGGAQRYWGSAQELPQDSRPVFIIPWDAKPELLPSQKQALEAAASERKKPHERHPIFPQAFRAWFAERGIDIDEYVMPLAVEKHRSIHRGERGGPWNDAWRKFIESHQQRVTKAEIYRYAGQLLYEFQLFGPVVPYWKQPPPLSSGQ
ncbi:SitA6 family polymorphic toxin lipoprotein [Hyalangium versicolor]|uniref:SitA6 family polymorphic toxin lipoprotein n=1 Tax=Hyalangium versicolor TaxID=2861190 RepID=UPI001CCDA44E|nr:TIGR02269 family lipoprotein [Hyalangium versicolor]